MNNDVAGQGPNERPVGRLEPERDGGDGELLWKAAKAAGYEPRFYVEGNGWWVYPHAGYWNPLADDGAALRLANKLWLDVTHIHGKAHAGKQGEFWCTEAWFPNGDQNSATRRAIVRAAAEVGKTPNVRVQPRIAAQEIDQ